MYRGLGSYFLKFLQTLNLMIFNPLSTTHKISQPLQVESESDFDIECFYVFQIPKKVQRMFCFTTIGKRYNSHFGVPVFFFELSDLLETSDDTIVGRFPDQVLFQKMLDDGM